MPNSIIAKSIMGGKIDILEFFRNATGCYCLFCKDKLNVFHANIDINDNKQLFWF
jgi:hypothetical protein